MLLLFNLLLVDMTQTVPVALNQSDEQRCIIHATEVRRKLVPPQYARSANLYPKYAGVCTFNAAYEECMNKK
tara:strand:+ start:263 stop:478 length:216 start_codon:yes stop_codon:yes gene_type:complete